MNATTATLSRQIGAILVQKRLITAAQLEQALQRQVSTGAWLGEIVVGEFGVSQDDLNRVLAEYGRGPGGAGLQERPARGPSKQAPTQEPLAAAEVRLRRPIGEIFVELGFISDDQLQGALAVQKTTGARIGEILVEQGILTRLDLASALAEHWESGQPTPAVAGHLSQNGRPAAPEPGRIEDSAASTDIEPRPVVVEEHVEPERPARRTWRLRGRSATAEDSAPQAWPEDSPSQVRTDDSPPQAQRAADEEHPSDPGDLEVKIDDLGRLLESLAEIRVSDALATGARLAAVEAALEPLAGMELRIRESVGREPEDRPDHLGPRLELLESRLDALAVLEKRVAVLAAATVEVGAELHALADRPAIAEPGGQLLELERKLDTTANEGRKRIGEVAVELRAELRARATDLGSELEVQRGESAAVRARIAEIQKAAAGAEQATAALRSETTSLGARIDELQEVRRADMEAVCAANETLGERLEALAVSRDGDVQGSRNGARALEEERGLRQDLLAGLDRVEASLGQRLGLIEESLASEDWERLKATVAELEHRLDEQVAIGEEQARASERAIRKGLASLGKRLVGPDSRYAGAGKGLRRSIERLGAAVVEAEARMADQIPGAEAEGCVAFAPTAAGYRLVELPGRPPEIGSTVELDGCDGPLVVTRYGRSPLPFDSRPCAYLGRD